eukprot:6180114-Pleurochrysis_carterae.AAC.2
MHISCQNIGSRLHESKQITENANSLRIHFSSSAQSTIAVRGPAAGCRWRLQSNNCTAHVSMCCRQGYLKATYKVVITDNKGSEAKIVEKRSGEESPQDKCARRAGRSGQKHGIPDATTRQSRCKGTATYRA